MIGDELRKLYRVFQKKCNQLQFEILKDCQNLSLCNMYHLKEQPFFFLIICNLVGYLNGITYHLIYILVSIPNFKFSNLQKQNQPPFSGINSEKNFFEVFQALKHSM